MKVDRNSNRKILETITQQNFLETFNQQENFLKTLTQKIFCRASLKKLQKISLKEIF